MTFVDASKQKITAWSYSRLGTWEECPFQAKCKFVLRLPEPDSIYAARGTELHKQAEAYIKGEKATPAILSSVKFLDVYRAVVEDASVVVRTELQQGLDKDWKATSWFGPQVYLRVVYDLHVKKGARVTIRDHKSGKIREEKHDDQLDLYATSAFGMDDEVEEVDVGIIYMDHGKETKKKYSRVTFVERKQFWDDRAGKMLADDIFAPRPGSYCNWCHYRKSNGGPCLFG